MTALRGSCLYIVDDDVEFRSSAALIFRSAPLKVVGCASAQEFLRDFDPSGPVCALVNLQIPDMDGVSIQERLHGKVSWLPVIYTTTAPDLRMATAVMRAGAWHVLEQPIDPTMLQTTIFEALQMAVEYHRVAAARSEIGSHMSSLSKREQQILHLLVQGHSSREIAAQLGTSHFTVEKQRANMMRKLRVKTLPELAMQYYIANQDVRGVYPPGFFWRSYDREARQ
jgi:two-component system CheB/CheR fusion protein